MTDSSTIRLAARFLSPEQAAAAAARLNRAGFQVRLDRAGNAGDAAPAAIAPTVEWGRLPYDPAHLDDVWTTAWDNRWEAGAAAAMVVAVVSRAREAEAVRLLHDYGGVIDPGAGRT